MDGELLVRVSEGEPVYIVNGGTYKLKRENCPFKDLVVSVFGYSKFEDELAEDKNYSSLVTRDQIGYFSCKVVDLTNRDAVYALEGKSAPLKFALSHLSRKYPNRVAVVLEASNIYIGDEDFGTKAMLEQFKPLFTKVLEDYISVKQDIVIWWDTNSKELEYLKGIKDFLPSGFDLNTALSVSIIS